MLHTDIGQYEMAEGACAVCGGWRAGIECDAGKGLKSTVRRTLVCPTNPGCCVCKKDKTVEQLIPQTPLTSLLLSCTPMNPCPPCHARAQSPGRKVLIATSAAEEGMDVPACEFVVRYNAAATGIQLVQSRGRARQRVSEFVAILQVGCVVEQGSGRARLLADMSR